jgi:hypothetical protein
VWGKVKISILLLSHIINILIHENSFVCHNLTGEVEEKERKPFSLIFFFLRNVL